MDYTKLSLLCVINVCVWTSVALATQDQQSALNQDQQPALTQDQQPALTQDQQPALTQDQQPVLTQDQQPALTQDQQPALTQDEQLASSPLIQRLLTRVDNLEKRGVKQQEEIHILKADMTQQRGYMTKLRSQLHAKDRLQQALLHKNSKSDEDGQTRDEIEHPDSLMTDESHARKDKRHIRGDNNRIRRAENEMTVAFSAALTQHMLQVGDKQNIVFDQVITNVGNAYNPHQGAFIAPVSGVYVFSTSILSYDSRTYFAYMTVNGVYKCQMYLHDPDSTASQTMVFELNQGDDVSIQGHPGDAYHGFLLPYTTFTGFLLQQNYPSAGHIIG